jgi:hypothetical protein
VFHMLNIGGNDSGTPHPTENGSHDAPNKDPPVDPNYDPYDDNRSYSNDSPPGRGFGSSPNGGNGDRGGNGGGGDGHGRPRGSGGSRGGGGGRNHGTHGPPTNNHQELWQINHKISTSAIPHWDGCGETAIEYLSKMALLVCLKGKMQPGLAEYASFHWMGRAQAWWDTLPSTDQYNLMCDWCVILLAICKYFLDETWLEARSQEFETMLFRQPGHGRGMPVDFVQRQLKYHSFLFPSDMDRLLHP